MNDTEVSRLRLLVRPFLLMLAFYLALETVSGLGAFSVASLPMLSPFKQLFLIATLLMFGFKIVIALLFILWMGGSLRKHGFTLHSPRLYILPAIILGIVTAAAQTAMSLPSMLSNPAMNAVHSHAIYSLTLATPLNGLGGMVSAFLFCGVMQEFISRRAGGHIRILRWDMPLAGIAVSLIAAMLPIIQNISELLLTGSSYRLEEAFLTVAMVLVYTYWYDRSRSLAAPVIAGALSGILSGVFYYLAFSGQFFNHMR